jgi:hypothetical protein
MLERNRNYDLTTALKIGPVIFAKYVLMGVVLSCISLAILFLNNIFANGSKVEFLKFASVIFVVGFVLIGAVQASVFLIKWRTNKLR